MSLILHILFLILLMALSWRGGLCTCVLESDFGFTLNCQFKKSSIFRVRNLGGVKGYVGLGFSVGDELGFGQSLSNLEGNKRRSTNGRSSGLSAFLEDENLVNKKSESARMYQGLNTRSNPYKSSQLSTIPPFKPIPPADSSTPLKPIAGYVVGPVLALGVNNTRPARNPDYSANSIPNFHTLPTSISKIQSSMKAPQAFKNALQHATNNFQIQSSASNTLLTNKLSHRTPLFPASGPQVLSVIQAQSQIDRISSNTVPTPVKLLPTAIPVSNSVTTEKPKPVDNVGSGLMADTVKTLSQATNISAEAIAAAINQKQQQLLKQQKTQKIMTTTTTTTQKPSPEPTRKYPLASPSRVMNAPREYYPVGYEKNFDDNFVSRVELPETSFYCGEQKHFPGLYADEDLGCMVFHVCAFTDDGLIMKSFLCPESTLFDQSILKCNWWFYVDCKSSKKLYDSNIPISKSYQLMKALSFFSSYNKQRPRLGAQEPREHSFRGPEIVAHLFNYPLSKITLYNFLVLPLCVVLMLSLANGKPQNPMGLKAAKLEQDAMSMVPEAALKEKEKETCVSCSEGECDCRPRKDVKTSSIAIKAAQEAKEAQEAQQIAGAQAAHQVKAQLAEKAEQAAKAAEAALSGKQVFVDQLEHEVREAQAIVQEEAASCQRTQINLQISCAAAAQAAHLLKTLTTALQISQSNLANSQEAAEGAQQELAEKAALLDAARCRAEALIRELCVARQDLCAIKQAACKAQAAARNAECNAQRNRRQSLKSLKAKRRINEILKRVKRSEKEINSLLNNIIH